MTPVQDDWSVWPWWRYDEDPPEAERTFTDPDGRELVLYERPDAEWISKHRRHGARIHDHDRDVTYTATVGLDGQLDYLRVTIANGRQIDENIMRRVPVATIRRVVLDFDRERLLHAAEGEDVLSIVLPGGLRERPTLEEVAALMRDGYDRPALHAMFATSNKRTVDGWMRRARQQYPPTPDGK